MRGVLLAITMVLAAGCASTEEGADVLPPDEQFARGMEEYEAGDYRDAIQSFQTFAFNYPQDPRVVDARWLTAEAYSATEDWATAAQEYLDFQRDHPRERRAPEALFQAGSAYQKMSLRPELDQRDTQRAINVYERVVTEYPASDFAERARERRDQLRNKLAEKTYLNAEFYFDEEEYEAAEIYATDLISNYPDSDWIPAAYALLARARCRQGLSDRAVQAFGRLEELFPESSVVREVRDGLPSRCRPERPPDRADDGGGGAAR